MREVANSHPATRPFRLPRAIRPVHYTISIRPQLESRAIYGLAAIDVEVLERTNIVCFHALRLDILAVSILHPDFGQTFSSEQLTFDGDDQVVSIRLREPLRAGSRLILTIDYVGQMMAPGSMGGLYPTRYRMPDGEVKYGFETMMQPTMARAVFPCWDEPDFKATFSMSLVVDQSLTCLGNMEVDTEPERETDRAMAVPDGMKPVVFRKSLRMSSYLVVLVAGYFNVLETQDFRVPVRVWAATDKHIGGAQYALDIAVQTLKKFEDSFGLAYPCPKLDMVAVPGHVGGMEHWGCVTYAEQGILLDSHASAAEKLRLTFLVAHELAHQWFGNIVTARWWDSLWLNESFAEWAAVLAVSQLVPGFDAWASFLASDPSGAVVGGYQEALRLDSNVESHAILDPNVPPTAAFDEIAYLKGCSVIRMLAEDLGVEVFLDGVREYLQKHAYGNATTDDLWDALSRASGQDVAKRMTAWTANVGYPVLQVTEAVRSNELVLLQARFLQGGSAAPLVSRYPVNVHMRSGPDKIESHLLESPIGSLPWDGVSDYQLNAEQVGFYRVSYPPARRLRLAEQFAGDFLSARTRSAWCRT